MKYGLSEEVIGRIISVFSEMVGVNRVIIYGSRAKGNYRKGSDIDLSDYNKLINENLKDHIKRAGRIFWSRS